MAARKVRQKKRGAQYVAEAALTDLIEAHLDTDTMLDPQAQGIIAQEIAKSIVKAAWDVEHFPVADRLQITLNLAALDEPTADPWETKVSVPASDLVEDGCPYISNGVQCALGAGHAGAHDVG